MIESSGGSNFHCALAIIAHAIIEATTNMNKRENTFYFSLNVIPSGTPAKPKCSRSLFIKKRL